MIKDDNHSKIFVSEKNKCYIRGDNKSMHVKILNEFKDFRKSYEINLIDTKNNYYKTDELSIKKHCTILLIDDDDHSRIFISNKFVWYY